MMPESKTPPQGGALRQLARWKRARTLVPAWIKSMLISRVSFVDYILALRDAEGLLPDVPEASEYRAQYDVKLGILKDFGHLHRSNLLACREMGVAYQVIDLSSADWLEQVRDSGCQGFLVHPPMVCAMWRQMYDERLQIIAEGLGKPIYPTFNELWLYENKRRVYYWLQCHGFPHPKTWVFYELAEALRFCDRTVLPIVYKSNLGAASSGVRIFRDRATLKQFVRQCLVRGIPRRFGDPRERDYGSVILQEYIPDAREWRMIRIGRSYFGYEKLKVGDFHSGSHAYKYGRPPTELLDLVRDLTTRHGVTSMSLDILVSRDGQPHITELQSVFGMGHPYEMCVIDDKPGRMIYDDADRSWHFEVGSFCQNYLCNRRVEYFLETLGAKRIAEPGA